MYRVPLNGQSISVHFQAIEGIHEGQDVPENRTGVQFLTGVGSMSPAPMSMEVGSSQLKSMIAQLLADDKSSVQHRCAGHTRKPFVRGDATNEYRGLRQRALARLANQ